MCGMVCFWPVQANEQLSQWSCSICERCTEVEGYIQLHRTLSPVCFEEPASIGKMILNPRNSYILEDPFTFMIYIKETHVTEQIKQNLISILKTEG